MARLSRVVLIIACLLAPAARVLAGFDPGPWTEYFEYYSGSTPRTEAVAVAPGGDAYMAGLSPAADGGNVELYRVSPDLKSKVWSAYIDMFGETNYPLGMVVTADGSAILCGGDAFVSGVTVGGFVFQVKPNGSIGWSRYRISYYGGFRDMSMDYQSNAVVAVYADLSRAQMEGFDPATGESKFSASFSSPTGGDSRAYAVSCTSGATYVGGTAYQPYSNAYNSWILKTDPVDKTKVVWNAFLDSVPSAGGELRSCVISIAARGSYVYALAYRQTGIGRDFVVYRVNPSTGNPMAERVIAYDPAIPPEPDLSDCGQIVMHSSMPILFASVGNPPMIVLLDENLQELRTLGVPANSPKPLGLAVSEGLYFSLFVGSRGADPSDINYANKIFKTNFTNIPEKASDMIIAPNVLDRSFPGGSVSIGVQGDMASGPFDLQVFDSAGRFVAKITGTWAADGKGNAKWDGTRDGKPVAPGLYYIYYKDKNMKKPVMVVNKKVSK